MAGAALPRARGGRGRCIPDISCRHAVPGMFGYTWNIGDFNGDGRPDIVVGDHYAGDRELHDHAGRVYLFRNGGAFNASDVTN